MKLLNAFSLNMVSSFPLDLHVEEISVEKAVSLLKDSCESCIGHADTAEVFSSVLGLDTPANRVSVSLETGDSVVIGQYIGPRLAEGATALPENATIKWLLAEVK